MEKHPIKRWYRPPAARPQLTLAAAAIAMATVLIGTSFPVVASGIPVVDAAGLVDRALKHMETMTKFVTQISLLKDQVEHQRRQLEALTGTRHLGEILSNPTIRDLLPDDARSALRAAEGQRDMVLEAMERIKRAERMTGSYARDRATLTRRTQEHAFRRQALMDQTQRATTARMKQIDQLQRRINQAQDPKAIADLQARLMVEQANIQADQMRADSLARQLDAEQALIDRQQGVLADSGFSLRAISAPLRGVR